MQMNTPRLFIFLIFALPILICSCGQESDDPYGSLKLGDSPPVPIGKNINIDSIFEARKGRLGSGCRLVNGIAMAEVLGLEVQDVKLSNATPRNADPGQTACFYKWDDPQLFNAGILVQLLKNPTKDEFPNYISFFIEGKKTRGEQEADGAGAIFEHLDWGDDGAYNSKTGKYYWRLGEKIAFAIAFNTTHSERKQYQMATAIGTQMTNSYLKR